MKNVLSVFVLSIATLSPVVAQNFIDEKRDEEGRPLNLDQSPLDFLFPDLLGGCGPVPELLTEINTHDNEITPWISADGLVLYFGFRPGEFSIVIRRAERTDINEPFGPPEQLDLGLSGSLSMPALSSDQLELYFVRTTAGWSSNDIYRSVRTSTDQPFGDPQPVLELNSSNADAYPHLSQDDLTIYFASDRQGSSGVDIWTATRPDRDSPFGNLQIVPGLGTNGTELSFFLMPDGLTGYVAISPFGQVSYNIYETRRDSLDDAFDPPQLVPELVSPGFDNDVAVTDFGQLYFYSDRLVHDSDELYFAWIWPRCPYITWPEASILDLVAMDECICE